MSEFVGLILFLEIALILFLVRILLRKILGHESHLANYLGIFAAVIAIIMIVFPIPLDLFTRFVIFVGFILVAFIALITSKKENLQPITVIVKNNETTGLYEGLIEDFGRKEKRGQMSWQETEGDNIQTIDAFPIAPPPVPAPSRYDLLPLRTLFEMPKESIDFLTISMETIVTRH